MSSKKRMGGGKPVAFVNRKIRRRLYQANCDRRIFQFANADAYGGGFFRFTELLRIEKISTVY
jgi:hypothetical protein